MRQFQNPPDDDSQNGDVDGNPFLLYSGNYVQNTINNDAMTPVNTFRTTIDNGANWRVAFAIPQPLAGPPVIAGRPDPTFYQAVIRPGATPNGLTPVGLVRVTNFLTAAGTVSNAEGNGFGSIGVFPGIFPFYRVFAANPANPLHVIYADAATSEMKYSVDGGRNWYVDHALTDAVTANGAFLLNVGEITHARHIGFDPYNPCIILVGTDQNGIIRSTDGGNSWSRLPGSASITFITSFYFPATGPIVVSTYGRGLWRVNSRGAQSACQPPTPPSMIRSSGSVIEVETGVLRPFRDFGDPPLCPGCSYIIVRNGALTDLEMKAGNLLAAFGISGGSVHQLDAAKRETPLSLPNKFTAERSNFDQFPKLRSLLTGKGTVIRGIVVQGETLKGIIISEGELPFDPPRVPYIRLTSDNMAGGAVRVAFGGTVRVHGEGFSTNGGADGRVRILLDGEVVAQDFPVDGNGNFRAAIAVRRTPGPHEILVEQQVGRRLTRERAHVQVIIQDRE
jgi:hypothetical protein